LSGECSESPGAIRARHERTAPRQGYTAPLVSTSPRGASAVRICALM
jgi:hypothetical protein